jgi:ubiquinone/menaquinone biosynthesis C-methylase UbiE
MNHRERVALIRAGVPGGDTWADFGAGTGAFTSALRALTGPEALLYAIDRDARALRRQPADVQTITADFARQTIDLPVLDGLLVANALHFVADAGAVIERLARYLRPGGAFIVVEYDLTTPRSYVPYPLGRARCLRLMEAAGLHAAADVGERRSPSTGVRMVALRAFRAA